MSVSSPLRPKRSRLLTTLMAVYLVYTLVPLLWLIISSTKTDGDLYGSKGLWFAGRFAFFSNIGKTLTFDHGIYLHWLANTLLYVGLGAGGATVLATAAGYGLAKYNFPGRRAVFAVVLGAVAIPAMALVVPMFLLFARLHLTDTIWSVVIPSLVNPFGVYLIWVYASEAVPKDLIEAARMDGAGEFRIFTSIALRPLTPGIVTVLLFSVVGTWNNFFLPLVMLNNSRLYPLTVGLTRWNASTQGVGAQPIHNLVITGSLLMIVPLIIVFFAAQRFWVSGLSAGSVKQ